MDIKPVLTYLSNRWAEGSTRRNLALFICSGAALLGFDVPPDQVGHWLQWINGLMMLVGFLGMVLPDAMPKKQIAEVLAPVAPEPIVPASDYASPSLAKPIPLTQMDLKVSDVVTVRPGSTPSTDHSSVVSDSCPGWNG